MFFSGLKTIVYASCFYTLIKHCCSFFKHYITHEDCLFPYGFRILLQQIYLCDSAILSSLVGVVKGVLTTIIGFFTFGGVQATPLVLMGVLLNTLGGAAYSYAKYTEKVTTEIEKHIHGHTICVLPDKLPKDHLEKQKNGFVSSSVDQDQILRNGFETAELGRRSDQDLVIEVDEGQESNDL